MSAVKFVGYVVMGAVLIPSALIALVAVVAAPMAIAHNYGVDPLWGAALELIVFGAFVGGVVYAGSIKGQQQ